MFPFRRCAVLACLLLAVLRPAWAAEALAPTARVHALKITILSTMLADGNELGEWGFSALVEADGHRILFDTGAHPDVVLKNAQTLRVDLTTVPEAILSHWHNDHTGGFLTLRQAVLAKSPSALAVTHVGRGIFYPRHGLSRGIDENEVNLFRPEYEKTGGRFVEHAGAVQLYPGVWFTGPVPRKYPERNWSGHARMDTPAGDAEDNLPEDSALVIDTEAGLVVVTGCGHAGVVNICDYARAVVRPARIHALVGGIHLFNATDATLAWTAEKLRAFGVDNFVGAHCTGVETVYRFRASLGLDRGHAVVGAVGQTFDLAHGLNPGEIAK